MYARKVTHVFRVCCSRLIGLKEKGSTFSFSALLIIDLVRKLGHVSVAWVVVMLFSCFCSLFRMWHVCSCALVMFCTAAKVSFFCMTYYCFT